MERIFESHGKNGIFTGKLVVKTDSAAEEIIAYIDGKVFFRFIAPDIHSIAFVNGAVKAPEESFIALVEKVAYKLKAELCSRSGESILVKKDRFDVQELNRKLEKLKF